MFHLSQGFFNLDDMLMSVLEQPHVVKSTLNSALSSSH